MWLRPVSNGLRSNRTLELNSSFICLFSIVLYSTDLVSFKKLDSIFTLLIYWAYTLLLFLQF